MVTASNIILTSGFDLKINGVRVKLPLEAKNTKTAGEIKLAAKAAGKRASYDWQQSTDGIAWVDMPSTLKASTVVTGLTSDTKYYYRVRSTIKTGTSAWSASVTIVVV